MSHDDSNKIPLEKQIWNARALFEQYKNFSGSFLWKPAPEELFCENTEHLIKFKDDLKLYFP